MFVKPVEGLKVRRPPPSKQFLPPEGAEVNLAEAGFYWQRRLRDGDVVEAEPPPQVSAAAVGGEHVETITGDEAAIKADTEKLAADEAAASKGTAQ